MKLKWYDFLLSVLIFIALLNWGLVAWFNFNLVTWLSFGMVWLEKTVYTIVAVFGIIGLFTIMTKALMGIKK